MPLKDCVISCENCNHEMSLRFDEDFIRMASYMQIYTFPAVECANCGRTRFWILHK